MTRRGAGGGDQAAMWLPEPPAQVVPSSRLSTAGIIVIGNEVLSGKVEEANASFLIRELREIGVELGRVVIIRDDVDTIASDVRFMSERYDHVFTSGGVGTTHDDVTMRAVARGLGRGLHRHPDLEALLQSRYGDELHDAVLRMADVPEGTQLVGASELVFPVVQVENVFVLPGVPEFLRKKFAYLKERLRVDAPFVLRQVYVTSREDRIAAPLQQTVEAHPGLESGSYPRFDIDEYRVKVTLEARDGDLVERGLQTLLGLLDADTVVRVD